MAYSAFSLMRAAMPGANRWPPAWRSPEPKTSYDVVIVGGGGHGLATAFHLARDHGLTNIAVLEKGWIGGGNTGRNTTVVRSDYYYPQSATFFDFSLQCYEKLSRELNFNVMFSQRSMINLIHQRGAFNFWRRRLNMLALNGVETEILDAAQTFKACPILNKSPTARFPILGSFRQKRAGTVRHDAVTWGYARAADALGVDIIQNCDVTDIIRDKYGHIAGIGSSRGEIRTRKIGIAAASHSAILADKAGFHIPVQNLNLQAFVTEPIKPILDLVVNSSATGVYVSQSDKGGIVAGAGVDAGHSYAQRGSFASMEWVMSGLIDLFPSFSRLKLLRQWSGTVDYTYDSSPIIGLSPVPGLYLNCGWGGGGFKAIPAGGVTFAHTIAKNEPHPMIADFGLDRFRTGRMIDEAAAAGIEH